MKLLLTAFCASLLTLPVAFAADCAKGECDAITAEKCCDKCKECGDDCKDCCTDCKKCAGSKK